MEKYLSIVNKDHGIMVKQLPMECPYCHLSQIPSMHTAFLSSRRDFFIFCVCANLHCGTAFNVMYNSDVEKYTPIKQALLKTKEFNDVIKEISPLFCEIYNQAYSSEQMELDQICGVGYRKALEFLIKDYLISLYPDNKSEIINKFLGKCIKENIADTRIKTVAERAAWLGNDETHYVRKWENKDVSHLKGLIDLCLHWIEAEINHKQILEEMPE